MGNWPKGKFSVADQRAATAPIRTDLKGDEGITWPVHRHAAAMVARQPLDCWLSGGFLPGRHSWWGSLAISTGPSVETRYVDVDLNTPVSFMWITKHSERITSIGWHRVTGSKPRWFVGTPNALGREHGPAERAAAASVGRTVLRAKATPTPTPPINIWTARRAPTRECLCGECCFFCWSFVLCHVYLAIE